MQEHNGNESGIGQGVTAPLPRSHCTFEGGRFVPCATAAPHPPTCTFAELLPLFQELFEPDPSRLTALIGRIRRVQHKVFWTNQRSGRGKAETFDAERVWALVVMMELTELGLSPEQAHQFYCDFFMDGKAEGACEVTRSRSTIEVNILSLEEAMARHLPRLFAEGMQDRQAAAIERINTGLREVYAEIAEATR